ncbi:MAG: gliding motility lipoprotein GldH [Chitinophagaceae bacterium]
MKNFFTVIFISVLIACASINVFEKDAFFPNHIWSANYEPSFSFTISDTSSLYNFFIVLRHTDAYQYNNIWLNVTTIAPGDTAQTQQLNLKLGDNTKGWLGSAMDDIIEHRILITRNPVKLKKGNYTFILQQIMRHDDLPNILNAGIYIQKIQ